MDVPYIKGLTSKVKIKVNAYKTGRTESKERSCRKWSRRGQAGRAYHAKNFAISKGKGGGRG